MLLSEHHSLGSKSLALPSLLPLSRLAAYPPGLKFSVVRFLCALPSAPLPCPPGCPPPQLPAPPLRLFSQLRPLCAQVDAAAHPFPQDPLPLLPWASPQRREPSLGEACLWVCFLRGRARPPLRKQFRSAEKLHLFQPKYTGSTAFVCADFFPLPVGKTSRPPLWPARPLQWSPGIPPLTPHACVAPSQVAGGL